MMYLKGIDEAEVMNGSTSSVNGPNRKLQEKLASVEMMMM